LQSVHGDSRSTLNNAGEEEPAGLLEFGPYFQSEGWVTELPALQRYGFQGRAVDVSGQSGAWSACEDSLLGLETNIVEGFNTVGALGDRMLSALFGATVAQDEFPQPVQNAAMKLPAAPDGEPKAD